MGQRLIESWQRRATQARIERCVRSAPRGRGFQPVGPRTGPRPRVPSGVLHCRVPSGGGGVVVRKFGHGGWRRVTWSEKGPGARGRGRESCGASGAGRCVRRQRRRSPEAEAGSRGLAAERGRRPGWRPPRARPRPPGP